MHLRIAKLTTAYLFMLYNSYYHQRLQHININIGENVLS